ncbi:MAG: ABC transporter substrate-binding protein [Bacilli bacterium]|nr:ABC transporter substrate-binding protein [Bacilli bacterium]
MKKSLLKTSLLLATLSLLAGCGKSPLDMDKWVFSPKNANNIEVGILQPLEHGALSLAREGFLEGLAEQGFTNGVNMTVTYQNANANEADLVTLAKNLVTKCDLNLGIGTGASQALHSAQINKGLTKPILFTAVTDAVSAQLVTSNENPGGYITGSSDANPVEAQIQLIKECIPDADLIGILYTQSETNSEVQANQARAAATELGISTKVSTCTDSSDISSVALALAQTEGLDAIYIPTDNNIAGNMQGVKNAAESTHVLVVTGEESMMKNGGHVTLSVNYKELGKRAGLMAASIMKHEHKPNEIPVVTMTKEECSYLMCSANLEAAGINLPQSVVEKCVDVPVE